MAINIKDLKNGGRVREVITYQGESIKVFEPTKEVMEEIFKMQEKFVDQNDITQVEISGEDMIYLFSKLTDLDGLDELTDEEMQAIIEDPTPALLMVQHVVEGIATEVYKMVVLSAKNRLMEQDFNVKATGVLNDMFNYGTAYANQNSELSEKMQKIEKATQKVTDAKEKVQKATKDNVVAISKNKPEQKRGAQGQEKVSKSRMEQKALLNQYETGFGLKDE